MKADKLRAALEEIATLEGCEPGDLTNDDAHRLGELHCAAFTTSGIIAALDDAREQGRRDVLGGQLWAAGEFAIKRDSAKGKWRRLYEEHATIVAHAAREMLRVVTHG